MPVNKRIYSTYLPAICLHFLVLAACVEPFFPEISESQESLVVEAVLTDKPGWHTVSLSRSSPLSQKEALPVEGAQQVYIRDSENNEYLFHEMSAGIYGRWFSGEDLARGREYQLFIYLTERKRYESTVETMGPPAPDIDSLYYIYEELETDNPDVTQKGVRFYLDMQAGDDDPRNFRWSLFETWEYHATHAIQYIWDGRELVVNQTPYMYKYCWKSMPIYSVYSATTARSYSNILIKQPLNYVSDDSKRLQVRYSLLVSQYTLSEQAFEYWNLLQKQAQESGGFYEKQPARLAGNIRRLGIPEELVLGYFNVSSVSEKRVFTDRIPELYFPSIGCTTDTVGSPWELPFNWPKPAYLKSISPMGAGPPYIYGNGICFDCRNGGGTIYKPEFWQDR